MTVLTVGGLATATVSPVTGGPTPAQQHSSEPCDYTAVYDETTDSIVSVSQTNGLGSGFVYDTARNNSTSIVVTNAHVVGDASAVTVQFKQGESRNGTVVGTDVYSDLAAVRVTETPDNVDVLELSENESEHGQAVAALGSPFGLKQSITHGIVSGLNRSMPTQQGFSIPNVIQTDAPISPGNSGGPLVDCDGTVVGVNTAGIEAQGAENIGFAISSQAVQRIIPSLIETGTFNHATLGVSVTPLTPAIAQANDLDVSQGVVVVKVKEDAPAAAVLNGSQRLERVGRQVTPIGGDVIVAIDGQNVSTTEDLGSVLLTQTRPGDNVTLTIIRNGQRMNVTTTLTERPTPRTETPHQFP